MRLIVIGVVLAAFAGTAMAGTIVTPDTNAGNLVNAIVDPAITVVGTPTFTGSSSPAQAGTFTGGLADIGLNEGIVLMSGDVTTFVGPNTNGPESIGSGGTSDDVSTDLGRPGDAALTALAGATTHDAAVLQFDFQFGDGSGGGDVFVKFVFASEEYLNWVGSSFNDVFGFFVDGVNIALIGSDPITINKINPNVNSAYYINNVTNTQGFPVAGKDIKFDGLTTVVEVSAMGLGSGVHSMKFAVADTSDGILDAGVFIAAGGFAPSSTLSVPLPASVWLGLAMLGSIGLVRRYRRRLAA